MRNCSVKKVEEAQKKISELKLFLDKCEKSKKKKAPKKKSIKKSNSSTNSSYSTNYNTPGEFSESNNNGKSNTKRKTFKNMRKTNSKLFEGKNYSRICNSEDHRQPVIVSAKRMSDFLSNPEYMEALDGDGKEKYILDGLSKKNGYICPRIWCMNCRIPISVKTWTQKKECPKCKGKYDNDQRSGRKYTKKNPIYIRKGTGTLKDKHGNPMGYWQNDKPNSFLKNQLKELGISKVPEELKKSEQSMYIRLTSSKKKDHNCLPCCFKKPVKEKESISDCLKKINKTPPPKKIKVIKKNK
jgi:hypothetical protein